MENKLTRQQEIRSCDDNDAIIIGALLKAAKREDKDAFKEILNQSNWTNEKKKFELTKLFESKNISIMYFLVLIKETLTNEQSKKLLDLTATVTDKNKLLEEIANVLLVEETPIKIQPKQEKADALGPKFLDSWFALAGQHLVGSDGLGKSK